ncbi:hypothetical protein QJS10_CPB18g00252 [Acorus calamus]|uniref:1-deoxy-D-xylulose-5-phosphate synthase n=1 Tax=Acorus calamus TaxID=4465 RepID=A0AAV9CMM6_ACOCL|nr:hypothetical protein QJS10_CPB18g00252 [Acorus calamus]
MCSISTNTPLRMNKSYKFHASAAKGDKSIDQLNTSTPMDQDLQKLEFSDKKPLTPILDTINYPIHMKNLSTQELVKLTDELRAEIVHTVSKTGGHLSASLGVTELTVALHHVFNTPEDKIIWDVGHQAYVHKILTGRRSKMHTIRQTSGLAGFPKRDESVHDAFGAGHSSTSISAGLGMAVGQELLGKKNRVVAVIGDGAMTAGQAYEAMNNAGYLDTNLIIVLNDNKQVSLPTATVDGPAPPVGALSRALTRLHSSRKLRMLREAAKVGRGRVVREGSRVAILGFGTILQSCVAAGDLLKEIGVSATIADARFCKPLDGELIRSLAREHEVLITVEEGSIGGFGSHVSHFLALNGLLDQNLKWRAMMLPDRYIEHGSQKEQMEEAGLSARHIAATVLSLIGENKDALHHLC